MQEKDIHTWVANVFLWIFIKCCFNSYSDFQIRYTCTQGFNIKGNKYSVLKYFQIFYFVIDLLFCWWNRLHPLLMTVFFYNQLQMVVYISWNVRCMEVYWADNSVTWVIWFVYFRWHIKFCFPEADGGYCISDILR